VTKTATLLGVSRAIVSEVMSAYMSHGKTTSAKRNNG
jgi:predicted transcriptional regulator